MQMKLYNTLTRKIEVFKPLKGKTAGLYACGPTVYDYAHIGNLRSYLMWDVLHRTLKFAGYKVKHVMNITDVGHLTSDADEGEDKMEKGAAREHKTAWEVAEFYERAFMSDLVELNIAEPTVICRATDHIKEQIKLIKKLDKKGFTYTTPDGIYFDTAKLPSYGVLARLGDQKLLAGIRIDVAGKRHPADFALWKFSPKLTQRQMEWPSPWGVGFPGWHIECSAMSAKYLGIPFDIHCGGIDHIQVHHTNEIAQTEAAEGVIPAHFWVHNEFVNFSGEKMAKSKENFITLQTLKTKNINPLAYRYFVLQTHYRKQMAFSWDALAAAGSGLNHLYSAAASLPRVLKNKETEKSVIEKFGEAILNDLNTPMVLSVVWEAVKDKSISQKTLFEFDEILGLKIKDNLDKPAEAIPDEVKETVIERDSARHAKDWKKSDEMRGKLEALGYEVSDTNEGTKITKK